MYRFTFADKLRLEALLPLCFALLHQNMSKIDPTGNTYEEDFASWYSNVSPAMQKEPRQIVLMHSNDSLVGYFQFYVSQGRFVMEEIQIRPDHQGTGLFHVFYRWLLPQLKGNPEAVEAYSLRENTKSQRILEHLGLKREGEIQNGNLFFYKGDFAEFRKHFITEA